MDPVDYISLAILCVSPFLFGALIGWLGDKLIRRLTC